MKRMKKLMALVIAVALVLAMGIAVFADAPTSGSVTVNPNYKGQTYTLYKLFDAKTTYNDEGKLKAVTYQLPQGKTADNLVYTVPGTDPAETKQWFKLDSNNNVVVFDDSVGEDWAKDPDAIAWAKSFGSTVGDPLTAASDNDENVKWENLDWGYYYVDTTMGSFIGVDTDNPDVEIKDKNSPPSIDKEITSAENGTVGNDPDKTTETDQGANEAAIAQVGDAIGYKLTVTAKPGAENYVVTDTLSAGLTPPAIDDVSVSSGEGTYSVDVTGQIITITFSKAFLDSIKEDTTITITYSAILNSGAVIGEGGNPNTVKLTWGHSEDQNVNYSEDDAKVFTAQVDVFKTDDSDPAQPLEGAGFVLMKNNKYYKLVDGVVTWVESIDSADVHYSGADGKVDVFTGLADGDYTLVESIIPEGYNKLADKTFSIAENDYTDENLIQSVTVTNKAGAELPTTGGMGTTIFYIIGAILVIGGGILLISKRRMHAE